MTKISIRNLIRHIVYGDEFQILYRPQGSIINGFGDKSELNFWIENDFNPQNFMVLIDKFF